MRGLVMSQRQGLAQDHAIALIKDLFADGKKVDDLAIRKRDTRVQPAIVRVLHPRRIRYLLAIKLPEETHIRGLQIEILRLRKYRVISKSIEKLTFQRHRVGKIQLLHVDIEDKIVRKKTPQALRSVLYPPRDIIRWPIQINRLHALSTRCTRGHGLAAPTGATEHD